MSNIDTKAVHANLIDLLRYSSPQTVHIILECLRNLHKIDNELVILSASTISEPILLLYQNFHQDMGASRVLIDLMLQLMENAESGRIFLQIFIPNCTLFLQNCADFILTEHNDIPFIEEEKQLNFFISLLELLCQVIY